MLQFTSIRCRAEPNQFGIVLCKIKSMADANYLRKFLTWRGIGSIVTEPAGSGDYRAFAFGITRERFEQIITGSNIELID